ncbi:MAG TPA: diguanylate cyclase [Terriglobales bacterium]|jgi:diguanylate cyclase (GGDEF)-like protein
MGATATKRSGDPQQAAQELKILVADDSVIYRKLVEHTLADDNHNVIFAKNGREALELFAKHEPALVITDWTMPDISGLDLCKKIRKDFQQHYAHIILLTSNTDKEEVVEGLAAGADDYLTKPFHQGELKARVNVGLRVVELHRQVQAKNRQLEEMALTDPLTGLANRRAIDIWITRQLSAAARHDFPIWVAICDLDHFKKVNDTYGHEAGDNVLKAFAQILKTNTRQSNICGRQGGEEFLNIITHVERDNSVIAFERIRKQMEQQKFTVNNQTFSVTTSMGIAGFRGAKPPAFADLLAQADEALYKAKHKGRNRIEYAEQ